MIVDILSIVIDAQSQSSIIKREIPTSGQWLSEQRKMSIKGKGRSVQ